MISKRIESETVSEPFHKVFPFGLSWIVKEGKKEIEHSAYFPYDD